MVDDTMSTNRQGRPLFVSASPGPHMKVFTPVRAFLPSNCRWVFDWLFRVSIPSLLGKEAISKTQLVLSDGDQNIYGAFDAARKEFYPQAKHGLCIYHLVTQTLNELERRMQCTDEQLVKDQKETFKRWMFDWMSLGGVESEDEYEISKKLMFDWLLSFRDEKEKRMTRTHAKVHDALRHNSMLFEETFKSKIEHHKKRWFFPTERTCCTCSKRPPLPWKG